MFAHPTANFAGGCGYGKNFWPFFFLLFSSRSRSVPSGVLGRSRRSDLLSRVLAGQPPTTKCALVSFSGARADPSSAGRGAGKEPGGHQAMRRKRTPRIRGVSAGQTPTDRGQRTLWLLELLAPSVLNTPLSLRRMHFLKPGRRKSVWSSRWLSPCRRRFRKEKNQPKP